jgi:DNA-binding MarR family transcriptional regulator
MRPRRPATSPKARSSPDANQWRHDNVGRLLNNAVARFEARVLELMVQSGLPHARISHISLTRNLDVDGTRISDLAERAGMTKQAMGELVSQCVALKLVSSRVDPTDKRARIVRFTPQGLTWLRAFRDAVELAETEMQREVGAASMNRLRRALARYGSRFDSLAS